MWLIDVLFLIQASEGGQCFGGGIAEVWVTTQPNQSFYQLGWSAAGQEHHQVFSVMKGGAMHGGGPWLLLVVTRGWERRYFGGLALVLRRLSSAADESSPQF